MASPVSDAPAVAHPPRIQRVLRSFGYAFEGLATMLRTQPNFVVHLVLAMLAIALALVLRLGPAEVAIVVLTIALVLTVECVNTALETLCDLVQPTFHPLVKRAKDVSAAAVLLSAIGALAIALLVFGPHLAGVVFLK